MPSLRKRNRTGKRTQWDIRYQWNGKTHIYTIGETDRRTAEKIYREFCQRLSEGKFDGTPITIDKPEVTASGPRISELAKQARIFAEANKSAKTLEREQFAFKQLVRVLGDIPVTDLTGVKIEEYKAHRLGEVTASSVNIEIRVLNTAVNQAVALGWLAEGTKAGYKQVRMPEPEPPAWLDEDQINKLLSTDDTEFKRFMQFLLHTGCRRNEALGTTWNDVDLLKRQIVIRGQIGKMGKRRTIPINDSLYAVLSDISNKDGRLFPAYAPNQVSMKFRRWVHILNLPDGISLHSLRSTFACHLIRNGIDIYTVSRLLGHSSVKVTEKHYLTLDPQHVQYAVNSLGYDRSPLEEE